VAVPSRAQESYDTDHLKLSPLRAEKAYARENREGDLMFRNYRRVFVAVGLAGIAGTALVGIVAPPSGATTPVVTPTVPALPPVPTGLVHHTPSWITANCTRDVTVALNNWIASVPNNSILEFPKNACYEIEGTLYVANRHDLLFDGNGAEFLAKTTGAKSTPPPGRTHADWPTARAQWWIFEGTNITLENMVIHGAANIEAPYEGTTWGARKVRRQYIGQYGVRFSGTDGALLTGCTITDTFSDLVGITANDPAYPAKDSQPARDISIENNVLERSDRDGPSVYDGVDILIANNTIGDVWGPIVDLEPVATRWEVDDVTVVDNTAGTHAHYFMTAAGASLTNDNLLFRGNIDTAGSMTFFIGSKSATPPIRQNVQIIDNRASQKSGLHAPLITVQGINGLVISGNEAPVAGGFGVYLYHSSDMSIKGNQFPGSRALTGSSGWHQQPPPRHQHPR
jgi:hypothetical protein